jgi:hypothetical protein
MTGVESPVLRGFRVQRPDRGRLAAYRIRGSPLFLHPVRVRSLRETEGGPSMEGAQPGPCVHPDGGVERARQAAQGTLRTRADASAFLVRRTRHAGLRTARRAASRGAQDGVHGRSEQSARGPSRVPGRHRRRVPEAIEQIVYRKVQAFASGVDPDADVVYETFYFEPQAPESEGNGHGGPGEIH